MNQHVNCPSCGQAVEGLTYLADPITLTITRGDVVIRFTKQQFMLAQALIDSYPMMITKERIYDAVFADHSGQGPEIKIVDVLICKIRPHMAKVGLIISTVWGQGYKLIAGEPEDAAAVKDASVRQREKGTAQRWKPEHDEKLIDLRKRRHSVTQCATIMRMPYMAIQRNIKRLGL